jgi:hypothetical protein
MTRTETLNQSMEATSHSKDHLDTGTRIDTDGSTKDSEKDEMMTEEDIDAFIQSEQQAASEGNNANTNSRYTPQIGMEFDNRDDAHHFFHFYGFLAGFEVIVTHTVRTTDKKRNNEIVKVEMKCHCYGKLERRKPKETRKNK